MASSRPPTRGTPPPPAEPDLQQQREGTFRRLRRGAGTQGRRTQGPPPAPTASASDLDRLLELYRDLFGAVDDDPSRSATAKARKVASDVKQAVLATRRYGKAVREIADVPLWKQLAGQLAVKARHGIEPTVFYMFRLYADENRARAGSFFRGIVDARMRDVVMESLGADSSRLDDKLKFFATCRANGVGTVDVVASFAGGDVVWHGTGRQLPARDLFAKPAQGVGGHGIEVWTYDGSLYTSEGRRLTADALIDHLAERSKTADYVLQPRLRNHPDLAALSSGGLCTVRVVTAMETPLSEPEVLVAVLRMAASSATIDNFGDGGLAAPVDPATGVLGPAVKKDLAEAAVDFAVHPATGHPIAGARVPLWGEVIALARHAHRAFADLLVVGWDVAVTTEGVVVVEGNSKPGSNLSQQPGARPLGLTSLPGIYLRALERARR